MEATIFQSHLSINPCVSAHRNCPRIQGYVKKKNKPFQKPQGGANHYQIGAKPWTAMYLNELGFIGSLVYSDENENVHAI